MIWIVLLIVHGLLAFLLLGALTHQAVSAGWMPRRQRNFVGRFAAVQPGHYSNAVIALFVATFFMGGWIYSNYRTEVRPALEAMRWLAPIGLFEIKEHFVAIAFGLMPTYWLLWKRVPSSELRATRTALTGLIALCAWVAFLFGHVLNNARGLGP